MPRGLALVATVGGLGFTFQPVLAASAYPAPPVLPGPLAAGSSSPLAIERIRYEDARRVLVIEGPSRPRLITRIQDSPDRLEVDLPGCVLLRPDLQVVGRLGKTLRRARVLPGALAGGGVRLVLELVPGSVASVAVRHEPRRVILALGASPAATGEAVLSRVGQAVATSSVKAAETDARPSWVDDQDAEGEAPRLDRMWHWPRILGAGSTFELRWHQLDDVEEDSALGGAVFGTSTGFQDLRWRHWLFPQLGVGLRGTLVAHDLVHDQVRYARTDWTLVPEAAVRAIAGPCELELRGGYLVRQVVTDGGQDVPASTLRTVIREGIPVVLRPPALTSAFMQGFSAGVTARTRLTSALTLDTGVDWAPAASGAARSGIIETLPLSRTSWYASFVVDVEPLTFRIGWEELISRAQPASAFYRQTLTGLHVGLGIRY